MALIFEFPRAYARIRKGARAHAHGDHGAEAHTPEHDSAEEPSREHARDGSRDAGEEPGLKPSRNPWRYVPPIRRRLGSGAQECARANRTILELNDEEYNSCANLEWQACAAKGRVPGQRTPRIVFANAPGEVDIRGSDGLPALGTCAGTPHECVVGYSNDDIFFLEVCIYSKICANRDELFRLGASEMFTCRVSDAGLTELQQLLVDGNQQ